MTQTSLRGPTAPSSIFLLHIFTSTKLAPGTSCNSPTAALKASEYNIALPNNELLRNAEANPDWSPFSSTATPGTSQVTRHPPVPAASSRNSKWNVAVSLSYDIHSGTLLSEAYSPAALLLALLTLCLWFLESTEKHSRTVVRLIPNSPPLIVSFAEIVFWLPSPPLFDLLSSPLVTLDSSSLSSSQTSSSPTKYSRNNPFGKSTLHWLCLANPWTQWKVRPLGPA